MADLKDVTQELAASNTQNMMGHEQTQLAIQNVAYKFDKFFAFMKGKALDDLQNRGKSSAVALSPSGATAVADGNMSLPPLGGLGMATAALAAIGASLAGLDDVFKAMRLAQITKSISNSIKSLSKSAGGLLDSLKAFGTKVGDFGKSLSKIIVFPQATKDLIQKGIDDIRLRFMLFFDDVKLKINTNIIDPISDAFKSLGKAIFTTIPEDFNKVLTRVKEVIRPVTNFFTRTSDGLKGIAAYLPTVNLDAVKGVIGSAEEGTGLVGFFSKILSFAKPLLKPIEFAMKTVLRPFFQIMLTIVDFITGFYEGFKSEDGSFFDKLVAGIEGGIKGVIKGFTDAIDMIFVDLPAWFLKKLGFTGIAEKLSDFSLSALVDPAWESVKNFFKNMFEDPGSTFMGLLQGYADIMKKFYGFILRRILPDPTEDYSFYDPRRYVSAVIPDSVYRYADINPDTGARISAAQTDRSITGPVIREGQAVLTEQQRAAFAGTNVVGQIGDIDASVSSTTPMMLGQPQPTNVRNDFANSPYG